jgi:hypothetical protein
MGLGCMYAMSDAKCARAESVENRSSRTSFDTLEPRFSFLGCVCGEWLADLCWAEERGPIGETQGGGVVMVVVMEEVV